jgi:hypothetical protein
MMDATMTLSDLPGPLPDLLLWGLIAMMAMTTILQGAQARLIAAEPALPGGDLLHR